MTDATLEQPHNVVAFHDAHWNTRSLVVGLSVFMLWMCAYLFDYEWLDQFSPWLLAIVTGLIPHGFLLVFPIVTRHPNSRISFGIPRLKRCLIEFIMAIPVVILTLIVVATGNYLVERLMPGTSLRPDTIRKWAESPRRTLVIVTLLFSFTFAPFSEELFFRGFLQNAFRARMPYCFAVFTQCLIFGFGHLFSYGALYTVVAFLLGLLLTLYYQWRKTLIAPIFVHAGINFTAALGTIVMMSAFDNTASLGIAGNRNDNECVIRSIVPNSAAAQVDLRSGDVIKSLDGKPILNFQHFLDEVRRYKPGNTVAITVAREGSLVKVKAILQRRGDMQREK